MPGRPRLPDSERLHPFTAYLLASDITRLKRATNPHDWLRCLIRSNTPPEQLKVPE